LKSFRTFEVEWSGGEKISATNKKRAFKRWVSTVTAQELGDDQLLP
jgi:hypothetical protein